MNYAIKSISVGNPKSLKIDDEKVVPSSIQKLPVHDTVSVSFLNITGDLQGDKINHGGRDKAVCIYPYDHYHYWEHLLHKPLPNAAFGENITVKELTEEKVRIGDTFQIGTVIVQVCQPRKPCYKVGVLHGSDTIPTVMMETGYTGYYVRVLEEGHLSSDQKMVLVEEFPNNPTIAELNKAMYSKEKNVDELKRFLQIDMLAENWKRNLEKRIG